MRITQRSIFLFWAPLALTWLLMAVEGPFLAAVIARLADPKLNLAAYGVSFAFAILIEAPVIMLLSASTALVEDAASYRELRSFANRLNAVSTGLLLLILVPPVFGALAYDLLSLPDVIARLTYGALWFFLPWPTAIGYRRMLQGVLIRSGRTRLVAYGTVMRLIAMSATALGLYLGSDLPGAWVGAAALSVGVVVEALMVRWMARGSLRELLGGPAVTTGRVLDRSAIARFYMPLAMTSFIGLAVHPMLTFFMGRSAAPIESLAIFPVVNSLSFVFRSLGFAYQDAAIALLGPRREHFPELARFAIWLGVAGTAAFLALAFTPLNAWWFVTVSGLTPDLAELAIVPMRLLAPLPFLSVFLAFERAILMHGRRTRPISDATIIELVLIAAIFATLGWGVGMVGVTAAFIAFLGGRAVSTFYLVPETAKMLRVSHDSASGTGQSRA